MTNVAGDGQTTLSISLPNVKFNEHYKVTVGVNGTNVFMYSQSFSKCSEYKSAIWVCRVSMFAIVLLCTLL